MGGKCSERVMIMLVTLKYSNETVNTVQYISLYIPHEATPTMRQSGMPTSGTPTLPTHSLSTLQLSLTILSLFFMVAVSSSVHSSSSSYRPFQSHGVVFFHSPQVCQYQVLSEALWKPSDPHKHDTFVYAYLFLFFFIFWASCVWAEKHVKFIYSIPVYSVSSDIVCLLTRRIYRRV